ncbi:GAF and ANTAR domain-containing protein [Micromonospora sp. NPDC000663]|uniref:GAF and ANTAR domain-containing protein n=1 Tax=Micromonospora sp. NPDC000663 TaxID=3364218 RepID=UPI0036D02A45
MADDSSRRERLPSGPPSTGTALDGVAVRLGELARSLQGESSLQGTLDAVVLAAVATVPGAWQAGISEVESKQRVHTTAATAELVRQVDQVQYDTGEGPCLTSLYNEETVWLRNLPDETRWPAFTHRIANLGVRSMLSFQLYVDRGNLGALNLYSADPDAFGDESEQIGLLFAAHAAVAMADAQTMAQLSRAVLLRDRIGQAKGILMERHHLTEEQAFALLARVSQNTNVKLAEVARNLTETGDLEAR